MSDVIKSVITPNDKTLRAIFKNPKSYYIDIYQREYKWRKDNIETLLNDVEVRFNLTKRTKINAKEIQAEVQTEFESYFLNTFLTHTTTEATSIVDGQQRLTTFLIVIIKLYKLTKEVFENPIYSNKSFSPTILQDLIFESDDFGVAEKFKIYNPNRQSAFNNILKDEKFDINDETQQRIVENYQLIAKYLDVFLKQESDANLIDPVKLTYYTTYILDKLSIVEIKIEKQKNVAMIFEVVNDRGLGLKPYEILKGKLIGNLEGQQKEHANNVWVDLQDKYYKAVVTNSNESEVDLDAFFRTFLRAKFANSESEYEKFSDKYHYEIYRNKAIQKYFGNFEDKNILYQRVVEDIKYFAELYLRIRTTYDYEHLIFNKLLDQNQQNLLIMSSVIYNDPNLDEKLTKIPRKFDQFHTTLRLLDFYESSSFQLFIYRLNASIRNEDINIGVSLFDRELISYLEGETFIDEGLYKSINELYKYEIFQGIRNRWTNFTKYILMRVDRYLSIQLDKPSYADSNLRDLEDRFNKNNRKRYGMHLEHIYANNEKNKKLFTDDSGVFDENKFNTTRNLYGSLLLLKDSQNISSGNDTYKKKIQTYSQSNLIWNELLVGHIDGIDLRNLPRELKLDKIEPTITGVYPIEAVEIRQKEIFKMIKLIWGF